MYGRSISQWFIVSGHKLKRDKLDIRMSKYHTGKIADVGYRLTLLRSDHEHGLPLAVLEMSWSVGTGTPSVPATRFLQPRLAIRSRHRLGTANSTAIFKEAGPYWYCSQSRGAFCTCLYGRDDHRQGYAIVGWN